MKYRLLLILFIISIANATFAQKSIKDSLIVTNLISGSFSVQFPGGEMSERFGVNSTIGGGYMVKTAGNWVWGFDGNFIFGDKVKNQNNIMNLIETSDGNLIDLEGIYADYRFLERGYALYAKGGKVIPVFGPNSNSGILLTLGAGYLRHKIYIENKDKTAPQIQGDYLKGYDELKHGPSFNAFLGYLFLGNQNKVNFYAGIDFSMAFTVYVHPYSFNTMSYNTGKYSDLLTGVKIGWIIPVYRRAPKEFYYY